MHYVNAALRFIAVFIMLLVSTARSGEFSYPAAKRGGQVDEYHGVKVSDPYRWLEDDVRTSKEVADWVAAENQITFKYLAEIPAREKIKQRLTELWNYEKFSAPIKEGG